jgi:hypothetical protein
VSEYYAEHLGQAQADPDDRGASREEGARARECIARLVGDEQG